MRAIILARSNTTNEGKEKIDKWGIILETIIITFLVTLIPFMIEIGHFPTIREIYVPILSSILMALFTYMRMRGMEHVD